MALRKLVCLLKPDKEIIHTGDHMTIRTLTSLRNYVMDFDLGVEFEEDLGPVDGRKCQVRDKGFGEMQGEIGSVPFCKKELPCGRNTLLTFRFFIQN